MNFTFRMYDVRLGKFLSVDPLAKTYPHNSPYAFAENRVIDGIELEGAEYLDADESRIEVRKGRVRLKLSNFSDIYVREFDKNFDPGYKMDHYKTIVENGEIKGLSLE